MNEIDMVKYKRIINGSNKKESDSSIKNYLVNIIVKFLIVVIILFSFAIIYKSDNELKNYISKYFFTEDISFTKIKKIYDKYLGGVLPIKKNNATAEVFDEKLNYNEISIYYDGVRLSVGDNYLVPSIQEGMVVFIGEKENYGNTIIIENLDGIDCWYGNITNTSLKLYDYVEKGSFVGETNKELYMVFSKDGKYIDYEEFIY